jgi:hypothetical protein
MAESKTKKPRKSGYKAPILNNLFFTKYDKENPQDRIIILIDEVMEYAQENSITLPGNVHNFFKDLVRSGKMSKQLSDISNLGYQLNQIDRGGEFINDPGNDELGFVVLPDDIPSIKINSNSIPKDVFDLIRTDEGGVLSVVEYCGLLDTIANSKVSRVQSPVKVAPNEIDGLYVFKKDDERIVFTAEAKSKGADVILKHQIFGAAKKAQDIFGEQVDGIIPLGIKIADDNTIYIVVFCQFTNDDQHPNISKIFRFQIDPIPLHWLKSSKKRISGQKV